METACAPFFICERTHFYSSLFTFPSESPVFIGIPRGEEFAATLHPLFTTLHHSVSADLQFAAVWVTIADLKSAIRAYSGLAPVRQCSCRAYYIKGSLVHKDVTGEPLFCFRHCHPTNSTRTDYKNTFYSRKMRIYAKIFCKFIKKAYLCSRKMRIYAKI